MIQHRGSLNNFFYKQRIQIKKQAGRGPTLSYFKFKKPDMFVFQNNKIIKTHI